MKKILLLIVVTLTTFQLEAQNYKFGKVSIEEVKDNVYEKDTTVNAVRLYKNRNTYVDFLPEEGWVFVTKIHERIKIINRDGVNYATKKINLYKSGKSKGALSNLKGVTYNIVGGKLYKEKLKKSSIFKKDLTPNIDQVLFTMPNVSNGAIVEWSYTVTSPFWKIDDLQIQSELPIKFYHAKIQIPKYFDFNKVVKGGFAVEPKEYTEPRKMRVKYAGSDRYSGGIVDEGGMGELNVIENVTEYKLEFIPALKEEPYVNNMNNYKFFITYELRSVQFPNTNIRYFATSWEEVVRTISKHDNFGKQLKRTKFLRDKANEIKELSSDQEEIINKVYNFVRGKMNWNGNYGKYTDKGIQKAFKESTGNVSEINLMLVGLLRECGITANPVLLSTRKHGIPVFPTLEGFNYVVSGVVIGENILLLDATDEDLPLGALPPRTLNWEGTMVMDNGQSIKVNLYPTKYSQINSMMNIVMDEDGSITGKRSTSASNLDAYVYRKTYKNRSHEELEEFIMNKNGYDDLTGLEIKNMKDLSKTVTQIYDFDLDDGAEIVNDEIYFSPLFNLTLETNPFVSDERLYPIDFIYPSSKKNIVNIKLPQGYEVVSLPEPMKMNLPDGLGTFLFNISKTPNGINLMSTFKINSAIIPVHRYQELKEFYNQRVKKETEKVVLKKI